MKFSLEDFSYNLWLLSSWEFLEVVVVEKTDQHTTGSGNSVISLIGDIIMVQE